MPVKKLKELPPPSPLSSHFGPGPGNNRKPISSGRYSQDKRKSSFPPPDTVDPLHGLSEKQVLFVTHYIKTLDATAAYLAAGYTGGQKNTNSFKMLRGPRVKAAVAYLQRRAMEKVEITHTKVLGDLEDERVGAIKMGQYSAAIRASELQGKHIGMFKDDWEDALKKPMVVIGVVKSGD